MPWTARVSVAVLSRRGERAVSESPIPMKGSGAAQPGTEERREKLPPGSSSASSVRASALLMDDDFRAKYPALAKALQETVCGAPAPAAASSTAAVPSSLPLAPLSAVAAGDPGASPEAPPSPLHRLDKPGAPSVSLADPPPVSAPPVSPPGPCSSYAPTPSASAPALSPSSCFSFASGSLQVDLGRGRGAPAFVPSPTVGTNPPSVQTTHHAGLASPQCPGFRAPSAASSAERPSAPSAVAGRTPEAPAAALGAGVAGAATQSPARAREFPAPVAEGRGAAAQGDTQPGGAPASAGARSPSSGLPHSLQRGALTGEYLSAEKEAMTAERRTFPGHAAAASGVEVQPPASRYIPADLRYREELWSPPSEPATEKHRERADQDRPEEAQPPGTEAAPSPPFAAAAAAGPPYHFLNRLEQLQRQYAGVVNARNAVEYQYQLFRSLDRPPILLSPPPRPGFAPATPSPGAYAKLPAQLPKPLQNLQQLYQHRHAMTQGGLPLRPGEPGAAIPGFPPAAGAVAPGGPLLPWQTTAPPPFCPAALGSKGPGTVWGPVGGRPAAAYSKAPPATVAGAAAVPLPPRLAQGQRVAQMDWNGLGPIEKERTVNPAIVFAKETMDGVLQQLQSEAVALKKGSREMGRKLMESKEKSEVEQWRNMGVDELLCELTAEQQAFIKEQLRAIDEAKENLQTMKSEAERIGHQTRDAFYRSLYTAGQEDEQVQAQREQVKKLEGLRHQLPPESAADATVASYVAQAGPDPLEKLEQLNLAHNLEQMHPQKCKHAVVSLLRQMGYRHSSKPVPVRRNGYPAQYYSKFPELYPYPEYGTGLPLSQQAIQERTRELQEKGEVPSFASLLDPGQAAGGAGAGPEMLSFLLKEERQLMEAQKKKQTEEMDWEEYFRSKREARERALEEERARQAREEALRAAEEARQAVELLAQRQKIVEEETRCAERKARAEREMAQAQEDKARALQEAQLNALAARHEAMRLEQRERELAAKEREVKSTLEDLKRQLEGGLDESAPLRRVDADLDRSGTRAGGEGGGAEDAKASQEGAARLGSRKPTRQKSGLARAFSQRGRQTTLTVEAAETLANQMKRDSLLKRRSLASPREAARGRGDEEDKTLLVMPTVGVQRTLTMYKTPLSRTLSSSQQAAADGAKTGDAQRLYLDKPEATLDDKRELETVQLPEKLLAAGLVVQPVETRKKAELTNNTLAKRLPPQKCETFVHLSPPREPRDATEVYARYKCVKELLATGQLGLREKAQDVYDFAFACCKKIVREDAHAQQYANVLVEAVPYYPYQIDIQRAGVIAFLNIFEHCKYQEQLCVPLFDCLTTLMAIEDVDLRGDIVAVMAAVIRPQVVINSDLVDLLLTFIDRATDAQLCSYGLHILLVARSPHRKDAQYALFVRLLGKWKFESTVPTRACLAIDAFAKRARLEELAAHERRKHKQEGSAEISEGLEKFRRGLSYSEVNQLMDNPQPPSWMGRDTNDIEQIVMIMDRHSQVRRLQGAACQALSSLCGVSLLHCERVGREGLARMYAATLSHKESQTIALSLCAVISLLASVPKCRSCLQPKMRELVKQFIARHRTVPEVVAAACGALAKLDVFFPLTNESMERLTLAIIVNNLKNSSDQPQVVIPIEDLIQRIAGKVSELGEVRQRLIELDAVEALIKSITGCNADLQACQLGCRAVSRLLYQQPESSRIYADLVRLRVMTALLFVLLKHHKSADYCRDALCCIANCASYQPCAEAVMERGMNVISKAMDANITDIEVVAQGCRCLGLLAAEASLRAPADSRAKSIISYAAERFSTKAETRRLLSEFLTDIFQQKGVAKQLIEPLWNPSQPFQTPRHSSSLQSTRSRDRHDTNEEGYAAARGRDGSRDPRQRSPRDPRALERLSSRRTVRSPSLSPLPSFRDLNY
ncbi:hypothetical protein BESB_055670 [Besnoitia besnoiti]|uniref:Uncharacterized protein n=1 Tax=Besnoitia besnoiti TaxID=94643 RepID=A0A2A9MIX4_BESBE|nr:hypothetical protein BESB_055670 [Besnoitia besnoiti]PFH35916.1 hypothetical protein BESB_055670 [Besnoitia besnoiti]